MKFESEAASRPSPNKVQVTQAQLRVTDASSMRVESETFWSGVAPPQPPKLAIYPDIRFDAHKPIDQPAAPLLQHGRRFLAADTCARSAVGSAFI